MRNYLIILLIALGTTVQAQFTGSLLGVIGSSGGVQPTLDYSIANINYSGISYDPSTQMGTTLEDVHMGGGKMWLYGNTIFAEYNLTDTEDISTGTFVSSVGNNTSGQGRSGINSSADGTKWMLENFGGTASRTTMTTAWDISTMQTRSTTSLSGTTGTSARGWTTNLDGTKLWGINTNTGVLYEFDVSPAWTGVPTYNSVSKDLSAFLGQAYGMQVSPDGQYLIIGDNTGDWMKQFKFGTIDDITTLTFDLQKYIGTETAAPYGFSFSEGGGNLNMVGISNDKVFQYELNNAPFTDVYPTGDAGSHGSGESNSVANWTLSNGTRGSLSSSSVDKYDGTYAIYTKCIQTASGNVNILSDPITVENGATYRVSFKYKTNFTTVNSGQYTDVWVGVVTSPSQSLTETEWTTRSYDVVTNSTSMQLRFYPARSNAVLDGELYIDDIRIKKL